MAIEYILIGVGFALCGVAIMKQIDSASHK